MLRGLVIALFVVTLTACSKPELDGVEPQRFERLDLDGVLDSPALGSETVIDHFDIPTDVTNWEVESPARRFAKIPGTDKRTLLVRASADEPNIVLERKGEFDLATFNSVRLAYTFQGLGWASIAFFRDGKLVHRSPSAYLVRGDVPAPINIPLEMGGKTGICDTMQVVFGGKSHRAVRVVTIETLYIPPGALLPSPDGPPLAFALGHASRLAQRVVTDRPIEAMVEVGGGAELRFSYGRTFEPLGGDDATLLLSLLDFDGKVLMQESFRAPLEATTWASERVDLSEYAGRNLTVRFSLRGPEQAWVVGEVALWGEAAESRPNVLFITSDTHRADHIGVAEDGVGVSTPHIDALAAEGVLFLDCIAPSNVTNPSHISMMTGIPPRDTGIVVNRLRLSEGARTLAETFAEAGYVTMAALGTAHLGHNGSGLGQGFDRMNWPPRVPRDAVEIIDMTEAWLDDAEGQPLFVWVHVFDAHWPYVPPGTFDRSYYDKDIDPFDPSLPDPGVPNDELPSDMQGLRDLDFPRAQYKGEVSYLDDQLGRLLGFEQLENAIIALTSDHGEGLGESGVYFEHAELYPGSLRVPMMIRWPDGPRGVKVAEPITNYDVGHTLAELAGLSAPDFPGRDLTELVGSEPTEPERYTISSSGHSASLEVGDDYLILHLVEHDSPHSVRAFVSHQVELFDLAADPECLVDLVDEKPERARELRTQLIAWLEDAGPGLRGDANESPEFLAQLAALGYVDQEVEEDVSFWEDDDCEWCRRMRR